MIKRRKRGVVLILIGVGILLLFFFFSVEGHYYQGRGRGGYIERCVVLFGLEFNYKYPLLIGGIIVLVGAGMIAFSFFPKENNPKKGGDDSKVLEDLDREEFFKYLGVLWHHLLTLELYIRYCLLVELNEKDRVKEIKNLKKGDILDRNSVISGNYLPDLIGDFNDAFKNHMTLDKDRICELRKAIAHGKIIAGDETPTKIYNFENRGEQVEVVYAEIMSKSWFKSNIDFVVCEINRAIKVYEFLKRK